MAFSPTRLARLAWTSLLLAGCVPGSGSTTESASQTETTAVGMTSAESTTGDCPIGMLGCACTGGGACDPGLTCNADKVCEADAGSSTGVPTTLDSSSTSSADDTTTGGASSSGSSTGTLVECTPTGDSLESVECVTLDPSRPFCGADSLCVGCGALGKNACMTATDGKRPICLPGGACGQCDSPDALALGQCVAASPHCNLDTNACEGCFEHSECPETACDIKARKCFPDNKIVYVRRGPTPASPCTGTKGAGGTMVKPYCDLETAIASAQLNGFSSGWTFHVLPSDDTADHGPVLVPGADIPVSYAFVHSPGGPFDKHTRLFGDGPMITVPTNVTLYVVDFSILLSNDAFLDSAVGVDCQYLSSVWLDDSRVLYALGVGVRGSDCQVHLRRTTVSFGYTEGVDLKGGSLHMVNSFITENSYTSKLGGGALRLRSGVTGPPTVEINYSTLVNNANEPLKGAGDTINCEGPATVDIRNSILGRKPGTGNAGVVCPEGTVTVSHSIVDGDFDQGGNTKLAAEDIVKYLKSVPLTGAYRVVPMYSAIFEEVAQWELGDPHLDYDREPRSATPGGPDFAGADVYVQVP
jgi:hypothetical protein